MLCMFVQKFHVFICKCHIKTVGKSVVVIGNCEILNTNLVRAVAAPHNPITTVYDTTSLTTHNL